MHFSIAFTSESYAWWLFSRAPDYIVGTAPSRTDNPIVRYIAENLSFRPENCLAHVATHLAQGEPVAELAIHNSLFITRYVDAVGRERETAEEGVFDLPAELPAWAGPLLSLYGRDEEGEEIVEEGEGFVLVSAHEALADMMACLASAARQTPDAASVTPEHPPEVLAADADHDAPHLELNFEPEEFTTWLRQRRWDRSAGTASVAPTSDHLSEYIEHEVEGLREASVYVERGIPKADLAVFTVELVRYGYDAEFRSKVYGAATVTVHLPSWTVTVIDHSSSVGGV